MGCSRSGLSLAFEQDSEKGKTGSELSQEGETNVSGGKLALAGAKAARFHIALNISVPSRS